MVAPITQDALRVKVSGKFLTSGTEKILIKGFSYGPFAPNADGEPLPTRCQVKRDFRHIRELGGNTVRVYFPPPLWFLDEAAASDLRVFIDVPWEKHRCFFEDWDALQRARDRVRQTAASLGNHPAVLAISVANEFPPDIVRFYGKRRVEQFIDELIGIVKEHAPQCLATFVNFPTTEFLQPRECDFCCFNVYLHDELKLGKYLDRLQHIAGNRPLVLGEYGIDSLREGEVEQAEILSRHLRQVHRRGLAGSVVFAYTDDWFTGGVQIDDWCFGVTRRDRSEKPASAILRNAWSNHSELAGDVWPKVSVVVCSFNGQRTLRECLLSLMRLDYADYEVIVVDDGSTDATPDIIAEFPQVIHHRQENRGLSAARNVGARLASGEIVAYTDDDCVVDEHWLKYLVMAMRDQKVEAIGGPNIPPSSDGWIARCVAASPGNPSHVMLSDQFAEHVPGCNMAYRRSTLLGLGGFDAQFRVAGDDVDMCWRFLDADLPIGYAPGAMVWHHRRATVRAYAKQQQGYGRSEAMVHFKHPQRCGAFGRSSWRGIIYGDGAVGLPLMPEQIYHGRFGGAPFQTIYRHNHYGMWAVIMSLEWHLAALFLLVLAILWPLLAVPAAVMWLATLTLAARSAWTAPLPKKAPWWCRPLTAYLYLMQPIWRGWPRLTHLMRNKRLPVIDPNSGCPSPPIKYISPWSRDLYWQSDQGHGRESLLRELVGQARSVRWAGDYDNAWSEWDLKLVGDCWHDVTIRTATEELGWPRRFTRARCTVRPSGFTLVIIAGVSLWMMTSVARGELWAILLGLGMASAVLLSVIVSQRRCLTTAASLSAKAGSLAELDPYGVCATPESERGAGDTQVLSAPDTVVDVSLVRAQMQPVPSTK
jgi:glycosyltransferase involved in cell wall biosynthesis